MPELRVPLGAVCAALLAACASKGGPTPENGTVVAAPQTTRVTTGAGGSSATVARTNAEDYVRAAALAAPVDRAWPAVAAAYDELKLPVTTRMDAQHQIASQGRRFRTSLGGTRMGLLFNCGAAASGSDAADSYELAIDVATTVAPAAGDASRATVQTIASALARPVMTSGEPVRCVSTGRLEEKIVQAATKRLQP